jgi:hypothetical protein
MWEDMVVGYFKVQYHYFPELNEKKHVRYRDSQFPSQESNPAASEQDTSPALGVPFFLLTLYCLSGLSTSSYS